MKDLKENTKVLLEVKHKNGKVSIVPCKVIYSKVWGLCLVTTDVYIHYHVNGAIAKYNSPYYFSLFSAKNFQKKAVVYGKNIFDI